MNGKGDRRRASQVPEEEVERRWKETFTPTPTPTHRWYRKRKGGKKPVDDRDPQT